MVLPYTLDLFAPAEGESVLREFQSAFDAWRAAAVAADRLQRPSTLKVYEDMWGAFTEWCVSQSPQVTLRSLGEEDLARFLGSREGAQRGPLTASHAWRLLSLIDRVLTHSSASQGMARNTAAAEYTRRTDEIRRANMQEPAGPDHLDAEQARRLVIYLSEVRPGAVNSRKLSGWQELRNITAVALHLGAGLTPGDLRDLPLESPVTQGGRWKDVPWKLRVPGNGNRAARETPIAPWAGQLLKYWLTVRAEAMNSLLPRKVDPSNASRTTYLFPGRSGQQWGKKAHYCAVEAVMQAAGIDDPGPGAGGSFRLRHTFALRQLRRKRSVEDVARWMGIVNLEEMARYRKVLDSYEEAV